MAPSDSEAGGPRWPGRVAVAIVRTDPPQVFIAETEDVLGRLVALELVAKTHPRDFLRVGGLDSIRRALLEERWADAVVGWIEATDEAVDAYPDEVVWTNQRLHKEEASFEIRMSPIFEDPGAGKH